MGMFDSFDRAATGPESRTQQTFAKKPPSNKSWASTSSRQMLKNYDKSPIHSPTATPPLSRNNSSSSINSVQSEPAWHTERGRAPRPEALRKTSHNSSPERKDSKKKGGMKEWFFGEKDPQKALEKERKKKEHARIVLGSRHAAAVKTRMQMDPEYRAFMEKHAKPNVKTAGISGGASAHSTAAQYEMRHPHSGPPAVHGALDLPKLSKIESHDEADDEVDQFEEMRRGWNDAKEHNLHEIPEVRSRGPSRAASPWASPVQSRESSPNRLPITPGANVRPALGSKRNSWAGAGQYHRDAQGRWRKTPPGHTPPMSGAKTPTAYAAVQPGDMDPALLAKSLAERLNTRS